MSLNNGKNKNAENTWKQVNDCVKTTIEYKKYHIGTDNFISANNKFIKSFDSL